MQAERAPQKQEEDKKSVFSYSKSIFYLTHSESRHSKRSKAVSHYSVKQRVEDEKAKQTQDKADWDKTTVTTENRKQSLEDKMASKIAAEVLRDNQKLRAVHSNISMKKILEREAKRQLLEETGGVYNPPVLSLIVEKGKVNRADPSNLPYLHKCPAV